VVLFIALYKVDGQDLNGLQLTKTGSCFSSSSHVFTKILQKELWFDIPLKIHLISSPWCSGSIGRLRKA